MTYVDQIRRVADPEIVDDARLVEVRQVGDIGRLVKSWGIHVREYR